MSDIYTIQLSRPHGGAIFTSAVDARTPVDLTYGIRGVPGSGSGIVGDYTVTVIDPDGAVAERFDVKEGTSWAASDAGRNIAYAHLSTFSAKITGTYLQFGDVVRVDGSTLASGSDDRRWQVVGVAAMGKKWTLLYLGPGHVGPGHEGIGELSYWGSMAGFERVEDE